MCLLKRHFLILHKKKMNDNFDQLIDDVAEKGWGIIENFIPYDIVQQISIEQQKLLRVGAFRSAGVGKGETFQVRPEIRSDQVMWLDPEKVSDNVKNYLDRVEELRLKMNREFFLGLKSFESHFAIYPPGSFYKKHLDNFKQVAYRKITCILYLNDENWSYEDGGILRIYKDADNENEYTDVIPKGGLFICFNSTEVYHEVLPTIKERYSITGWLRNTEFNL
jgi:SM-20-related protein